MGSLEGKRITLADIAAATDVSKMTVSLAMRNHPRISKKTRLLVQQKAKELGYSPDPMLSALVNYRHAQQPHSTQSALAWINPFRDPKRQHLFTEYELYFKGASDCAAQYGYRLEEFATAEIALPRLNTIFKTRSIKGILIAPLPAPKFRDPDLDWYNFPWKDFATISFGRSRIHPETHFASSAQARNTIIAFENIRAKGYRRIGFIGQYNPRRVFCMGAYFEQLKLQKTKQIAPLLFMLEDSEDKRRKMIDQWLKKNQPEAILTDTSELVQILSELGIHVPNNIGLATTSISDTSIDSGIDQNPEEIGRSAARMLTSLIHEQNFGIPSIRSEILVEGKWINGSTLPNRNGHL
ncbi:MAG: LacI family DNA-binding transcriptional regulator [Pontiella sp.]